MLLPLDSLVIVPVGQFLSAAVVHLVDALDSQVGARVFPHREAAQKVTVAVDLRVRLEIDGGVSRPEGLPDV